LRIRKDLRAVSTILTVLLILAAAILGGLISYMWAIAPFFATPSNGLSITSVNFPLYHADYFDVTVLNPSYSSSGTNITSIYVTAANETSFINATDTNPGLPVFLDAGASVTIQCTFNWGAYAGQNITVDVLPQSGIGATYTVQPAFVGLTANVYFNATETVQSFVMTVQNDANSAINLTLSGISIDGAAISNVSATLPEVINVSNTVTLTCNVNWGGYTNPDIVAETQEGYTAEVTEQINASTLLLVDDVQFNENNPDLINVTLLNSPSSNTPATVTYITIANGTTTPTALNQTVSSPTLPYTLDVNASVTLNFAWNWTADSYRNLTIGVTAFTSQGFVSQTATFTTPAEAAAQVDQTEFDLGDTGHFTVNVTNLPYSLQREINVTEVDFNNNAINISAPLLAAGDQAAFDCAFNWSSFVGQSANITVHATYDDGNSSLLLPFQANVTYFEISSVSFSDFSIGNPYMNVTVSNSQFSKTNANITQVFIQSENGTQTIDGTISYPQISPQYPLTAGTEQTFTCPWNWSPYAGQDVTVIVQTADGFQASMTLKV